MKFTGSQADLPSLSIRRPVLIVVLNLLIIIAGLAALNGVEVRELPDVDRPIVTVTAQFPGAAPETVDTEVTRLLEGAIARVNGVQSIYGSSEEDSTRIVVQFRPGADLDAAANDIREAIAQVERDLPPNVERLAVIKADNNADPVVRLTVASERLDLETLSERVDTDLIPLLLNIPGVADVTVNGDRQRVLRVMLDPMRMAGFGLTISEVSETLRDAPFDVPAGSIRSSDQQLIVRADATSVNAEQVAAIVIRDNITIGDIANVYFGPADARNFVRLDGSPVLGLAVIRQASSNAIEISNEVQRLLGSLDERFPEMDVRLMADDAEFIRDSIREVLFSLTFTVILVVSTLWLFIGAFRPTIIPALAIPVSLIGSLAALWILGFSINILTLLALVLATGLIVDDAIVVTENIQRRRAQGMGARAAAVVGTREVFFAVVATTAVLVAVFVPIAFLPSTAGRLFREFGGVLAVAVMISSFVALSLVPAFAARLPLGGSRTSTISKFGTALRDGYIRSLSFALKHALWVIIASLIAAGAAFFTYQQLNSELLPPEDRGRIRIFAEGPDGVGLPFMDRQAQRIEDILLPYVEDGDVARILTIVGQWDPNRVFVVVPLVPWGERERSQQDILAEIREPLASVPGAPGRAAGANSLNLRGAGGGIEVAITGDDYAEIYQVARDFAAAIEREIPELGTPSISYNPSQPQMRVNIDRVQAESLDVPLSSVAATLRVAINGDELVDLNVADQAIPIILQAERSLVRDPSGLTNLYVNSRDGELIPLSALVSIQEEGVAAELERHAQRRAIELDMDLPDTISLGDAVSRLRALAQAELPSNSSLVLLGEAEAFEEASQDVLITFVFALIIVFLVLAAQFESVNSAVVVMITVPFGLAAAMFALFLTGTSLNIYSQIGLVMLIGLIAKNSILLVEFANQLRDQGRSVYEAVSEAAEIRVRPITMTLVSTLLGTLPLILSTGAGAEARNAIGWVVFGGLGIAVLFTLYLTPVLYLALARFSKPRADESRRLEQELDDIEASDTKAS
ncbi:efflux RND transporter permease subunit [Aliidiomarina sanyensis]|uniref:Multidrug transporter AcrB n=1 Tax=Aliidiomarina sanyensis TaxID=1249555 RepID=A0A432WSA3_9GAMM|nr:efflux RND transporter permease subunit [Aliidiomarina sanyensis]RUO36650.1 multidrug transporter AcrB [Aliidiomarina sanyensis]